MQPITPPRSRKTYVVLLGITMLLGLGSRKWGAGLPAWVAAYAGDALWAVLVFWLVGFGWVRWPTWRVAGGAGALALSVEVSQLYQAPWLNAVRHTALGGLVLGYGFLWTDLLCYCVGIGLGGALEYGWRRVAATTYTNPRGAGRVR